MISVKARYDGKAFIPEEPVDLPAGSVCELVISPPAATELSTLMRLAQLADKYPENPGAPTDLAAQHDHYLYRTPKKP
jgi:hypothetical protein